MTDNIYLVLSVQDTCPYLPPSAILICFCQMVLLIKVLCLTRADVTMSGDIGLRTPNYFVGRFVPWAITCPILY